MLKKIIATVIVVIMCLMMLPSFGCGDENVLKVYNCYDYILDEDDDSLISDFEAYYQEKTGKKIKVEYSCFDTPEDAYNNLNINPNGYDLVCPSDYMIEKMAHEGMLQKFVMDEEGDYMQNVSPYINDVFSSISWKEGEETVSLADYAVGYMWGTLGLIYNPDEVDSEDMHSWSILWDSKYKKQFSIKDSVRDTFFIGLAKHYNNELNIAKTDYLKGGLLADYKQSLKGYFNDTSIDTVNAVKQDLINLAKNCKNLEVDEGKDDITKGRININFAWSGDAVYALDSGEDNDLSLEYYVPDEGSNIWFDGWVIPKNSQKVEEAKMFLDFISNPTNVVRNMEYIGYTSCVAGSEVFEYVQDCYDEGEGDETDLSYFFGEGEYTIKTTEKWRQFYTQYPPLDVINRCAVMSYFDKDANNRVNNMWTAVKSNIN